MDGVGPIRPPDPAPRVNASDWKREQGSRPQLRPSDTEDEDDEVASIENDGHIDLEA